MSLGDGPGHTRLTERALRRLGWCIQEDEFGQTMELYAPLIAGRVGGSKSCLELQEFCIQISGVLLQISPSFPWLLSTFFAFFARQEGATSPPTQLIGIGVNIAFALADVAEVVPSGW